MPCNLTLTTSSVGPNHPGLYLISPSVNTVHHPEKSPVQLTYTINENAFGILRYRERPRCVGVKQSYLGLNSD